MYGRDAVGLLCREDFVIVRVLPEAGVAQLVEHLICNQRVGGSNPFASSTDIVRRPGEIKSSLVGDVTFCGAGRGAGWGVDLFTGPLEPT